MLLRTQCPIEGSKFSVKGDLYVERKRACCNYQVVYFMPFQREDNKCRTIFCKVENESAINIFSQTHRHE